MAVLLDIGEAGDVMGMTHHFYTEWTDGQYY